MPAPSDTRSGPPRGGSRQSDAAEKTTKMADVKTKMPTNSKTMAKGKGIGKGAQSPGHFLSKLPLPLDPSERRPAEHDERYHVPLLLSHPTAQDSLLTWFESVRTTRDMAWRKDWTDPSTLSTPDASLRGYEVLVSETMLQQTRIETVKSYYANWMEKFPTWRVLAEASAEDVMAAWSGLGYYSRATRLHTAAKTVHERYGGVLPSDPSELEKEIAGVGRYTAGAVSSIVYGIATPLLDGNVSRVLSRQMGLYADVKSKAVSDVLWRAAELLVVAISRARLGSSAEKDAAGDVGKDEDETEEGGGGGGGVAPSATPGQWNQALMELGSTICTPFPRCAECPIQKSCRAYTEGQALARSQTQGRKGKTTPTDTIPVERGVPQPIIEDIESLCSICEPMPSLEEALSDLSGDEEKKTSRTSKKAKKETAAKSSSSTGSKLKQTTLSFAPAKNSQSQLQTATETTATEEDKTETSEEFSAETNKVVQAHVRQFPLKIAKKKVREEDAVVCIIEARPVSSSAAAAVGNGEEETVGSKNKKKAKRKAGPSESYIHPDSLFLIKQRPDKGLLASMWEMPTYTYPNDDDPKRDEQDRLKRAKSHTQLVLKHVGLPGGMSTTTTKASSPLQPQMQMLGLHTHVFSHLKMHMHAVHLVVPLPEVDGKKKKEDAGKGGGGPEGKWVTRKELEEEYSMGNGMRICWAMAIQANEVTPLRATLREDYSL
ncbi:unnamed protein product [Tilletia controversa]|uniref:Adenine DNA glycosylase n=1 Tax=Tilletia controversa TaxID=13291 RepID=A0A8X7MNS2_9BASI|nr:hypothetical protein CF328_g5533 [Tilletia controversa]KAE8243340.1 hypothetical protein A4X06_0g6387 [Tilletia controversa]CAD6918208.1 unnamed protein product [Tilletia controversa]CAD6924494.1 unnamed protein product [Tilletia controversa]CAD6955579.1 unnamed protein product [Tilletia controversa]